MITCAVNGCPSTQTTRIDGNLISFFAFPEDDLRKNQWLYNCNLASGIVNDNKPLHLCELHFEKVNFTVSNDLKSNAVPTLFGRIELPKKHKSENILQTTSPKVSVRQKKLNEHLDTLVTVSNNSLMQDNTEDPPSGSKADISINHTIGMNGSTVSNSITNENLQSAKTYRLIIQIDKIRSKPGPKCKKLIPLTLVNNDTKDLATNERETTKKLRPLLIKRPCATGKCKLRKCAYNSRLSLQCEICDKYYIAKKGESKGYSCTICCKIFLNPQSLYIHIRKHFMCDICQTECSSQVTYDKHIKLHVSTDPLYPYKCHQCHKIFELKEGVKQHCLIEHPKIKLPNTLLQVTPSSVTTIIPQSNDYRCTNCNITFKSEHAYKNHISAHGKKDGLRCNINETNNIIPVPNPLTGSQIGILQAVKFSCRVCSKEFDNVGEVDLHTRTHLEDAEEDLKCNICKKIFKSSAIFSEHLKHHLSRAHPCPICSKAFINKTTLKIHLKTHSDS